MAKPRTDLRAVVGKLLQEQDGDVVREGVRVLTQALQELEAVVEPFRTRQLTEEYPYLWVDATYLKVRVDGRVVSQATAVAVGVTADGERHVLGVDAGASEDGAREAVAAVVRTVFAQPDHAIAMAQLEKVVDGLRPRFAQAATLLADAAEDLLAHKHFPAEHRTRLHSTNPLERLNKEIKRRSNVVGIFPNPPALLRLVGALLMEQDDERAVSDRRYFSAESMRQLTQPVLATTAQELLTAIA